MDLPYLDFIMDWNQNIFFNYHNNNNKSLIALGKVSYMNYKTSLILIKDQIFRDIIYYQISPKTFCQCPCWYPSPLFLTGLKTMPYTLLTCTYSDLLCKC